MKIDLKDKKTRNLLIIAVTLASIILCLFLLNRCTTYKAPGTNQLDIDDTQGDYEKPEEANFMSKNITLPGWGSFNIPANTTQIDKGFEFYNPEANTWQEAYIYYGKNVLENIFIGEEYKTNIEHYGKLAGLKGDKYEVTDYDSEYFKVDGNQEISVIKYFDGEKVIKFKVDDKEYELKYECLEDKYYMTFGLYLEKDDELLYQSKLVEPGKYIQSMEISRPLSEGTYDAYVLIQPYRSDRATQTNSGKVVIKLNVK